MSNCLTVTFLLPLPPDTKSFCKAVQQCWPHWTSSVNLMFIADVNQLKAGVIGETSMAASSACGLLPAAGSSKDH